MIANLREPDSDGFLVGASLFAKLPRFFWAVSLAVTAMAAGAEEPGDWEAETWGTVNTTTRLFFDSPLDPQQSRHHASLAFEPTLYIENLDGQSFTFRPHLRAGESGTNAAGLDIREAYFLTYGNTEAFEWELRLGIDQVFWGTAESNNLVNIINQTDFAADRSGDSRLGQPMIHGTIAGDFGILNLLVLPYHRPRTFPGRKGRLRPQPWISDRSSDIRYTHEDGDNHVDFAARYGTTIGSLDVGVSAFKGTAREPTLAPKNPTAKVENNDLGATNPRLHCYEESELATGLSVKPDRLLQCYRQIEQVGLDLQLTLGDFLGKAEAITRSGFETITSTNDSLKKIDYKSDTSAYKAFVIGGEYSFYGIFESNADLTLFGEWNQDQRRESATTAFQNDLFLAARYNWNDAEETSFTAAVIDDLDYPTRSLSLLFERRLSDSVLIDIESFWFLRSPNNQDNALYPLRDDKFVEVSLVYGF
ncbi:MAG: hypothetical protein OXE84_04055 [Rhodobacteraceae bacterium]|nr:hypothetical protein [Paracoccaceae bacterium]MCY4328297.1 hypothetical protein [Paracoccaceae bacterium]